MSDSETSSDIKVKYENSNGDNLLEDKSNAKKVLSSDTDYYFNIIANPTKVIQRKVTESDSSSFNNIIENNSESSNSSKSSNKNRSSEKSKSSKSSHKSNNTSESKEKYERINLNKSPQQSVIPPLYIPLQPPSSSQKQPSTFQQPSPNQTSLKPPEVKELTLGEIRMKKIEMLRKLSEIKSKGYQLSKDYDFNSSLDEMEYEYDLLKSFADKRNGVKVFKSGLLQVVSLVEFLNDKYDPFDFHLSGWGDHMQVETESWEDVLEEIYEKYKGTGRKMPPEIRLLLLIIASASAFHFTKSQSANLPGLDSLLASNPGLLSKIINPSKNESSQFMTPQEINIEKQRAEIKKNQSNKPTQQMPQMPQMMSQMMSQMQQPQTKTQPAFSAFGKPSPSTIKHTIKAPDQVKDILNRIHSLNPKNIKQSNTETQDETSSNNDRIISESTISESNPRKRIARKQKKAGISII
jgi:hypothetical protein